MAVYGGTDYFPIDQPQSTHYLLKGRRYSFYIAYSNNIRNPSQVAFSSNGIYLTVDGDGHLELNQELEPRNFIETAEGELTAQPSAVTIEKAGYSGISINGLAEATPYQLMKGRRYAILTLYAQPFTHAPEGYVSGIHPGAHFDIAGTGNVIPHGTPSQETFESVGADPNLRKTLRARVLTVTPQLNSDPDLLNVTTSAGCSRRPPSRS